MKKERKTSSSLYEKCRFMALEFFRKNREFKEMQGQMNELKKNFYSSINEFFDENNIDSEISFSYNEIANKQVLRIKKVQKVSVNFDAESVEKALGKEYRKQIIIKKYEVNDMAGLTTYLKECGVNPNVFKNFIDVKKSVDVPVLENLVATGKVSEESLDGCYMTEKQNPYYTVTAKKE